MKYVPLHDKVLVERSEVETYTTGGLILPDTAAGKSSKGKVLAVGPGKLLKSGERSKMSVAVGDLVLFHEGYGVKSDKLDGQEVLFLSEGDLLAIIKE